MTFLCGLGAYSPTTHRAYVVELCSRKIPYNYLDLALCAMPKSMASMMASDIPTLPVPKTLFCSQAVVLILRHALGDHPKIVPVVAKLCSRCVCENSAKRMHRPTPPSLGPCILIPL